MARQKIADADDVTRGLAQYAKNKFSGRNENLDMTEQDEEDLLDYIADDAKRHSLTKRETFGSMHGVNITAKRAINTEEDENEQ